MFWFWPLKNPHTELHEVHQESIDKLIKIIKDYQVRIKHLEDEHLKGLERGKATVKLILNLNKITKSLLERIKELESQRKVKSLEDIVANKKGDE